MCLVSENLQHHLRVPPQQPQPGLHDWRGDLRSLLSLRDQIPVLTRHDVGSTYKTKTLAQGFLILGLSNAMREAESGSARLEGLR